MMICTDSPFKDHLGLWDPSSPFMCSQFGGPVRANTHRDILYTNTFIQIQVLIFLIWLNCPRRWTSLFPAISALEVVILVKLFTISICKCSYLPRRTLNELVGVFFSNFVYSGNTLTCAKLQQTSPYTLFPNIKQTVYLGHSGATYGKASKCNVGFIEAHGLKKKLYRWLSARLQ